MNISSTYPTLSLESEVALNSFEMITIMDGPGVKGLERYFVGYYNEDLRDADGTFLARPVGHHELPHPMTLPEIEEWALKYLSVPEEALTECEEQELRTNRSERADQPDRENSEGSTGAI
ncbi:hypothetical protein EXE51_08420 [Halorubrum sp. CGM5_25_10-8B]|uniref:hypothetical protein n=1 Tax=Halorubrum sp. CGM5_25_10-8B TaxID=2518115 RepID=UPI0010F4F1DF|nr:hypothetical protein [Halorubrum sp. CGM5_25_10-8B]TKX37083.1 hypothetical protein EXE51_08420 [Halorubrum sp. CGM5_25_10-8B]